MKKTAILSPIAEADLAIWSWVPARLIGFHENI
jgi:hypothetical protein